VGKETPDDLFCHPVQYYEARVFSCGEKKSISLPGMVLHALRYNFAMRAMALDRQAHKMNEVLGSRDNEV
jgi:hypothetical protein